MCQYMHRNIHIHTYKHVYATYIHSRSAYTLDYMHAYKEIQVMHRHKICIHAHVYTCTYIFVYIHAHVHTHAISQAEFKIFVNRKEMVLHHTNQAEFLIENLPAGA